MCNYLDVMTPYEFAIFIAFELYALFVTFIIITMNVFAVFLCCSSVFFLYSAFVYEMLLFIYYFDNYALSSVLHSQTVL